jgi:hypothetical protein
LAAITTAKKVITLAASTTSFAFFSLRYAVA